MFVRQKFKNFYCDMPTKNMNQTTPIELSMAEMAAPRCLASDRAKVKNTIFTVPYFGRKICQVFTELNFHEQ